MINSTLLIAVILMFTATCKLTMQDSFGTEINTHRGIHCVWSEAAIQGLTDAGQQAVCADSHEGYVQIWRIHIHARWQVLVTACDLSRQQLRQSAIEFDLTVQHQSSCTSSKVFSACASGLGIQMTGPAQAAACMSIFQGREPATSSACSSLHVSSQHCTPQHSRP